MAQVLLKNLTKRFGEVTAVDKVNLEVRDKEFLVLVGPSGCGKTTTLRMVAGLEDCTEGEIQIGADLVNDLDPKDRNIAMVFQNYALYPHMNARQNMAFGLKLRKVPKADIDRRVGEAARMLGIEDLLERKPKELSGGQKQRVALGRTVVRQPEVFLFDEPLSNLDAKLRVDMREELSKLHRRLGATIIYVTHDQVEAMTLGERIVVMRDGRIQQVGTPREVYYQPVNMFVAGFIGSPAMNFFPGRLVFEDPHLWLDSKHLRLKIPDQRSSRYAEYLEKEIVLGIRPEDISDNPPIAAAGESYERILARVEIFESLGPEVVLGLSLRGHSFRARVKPDTEARVDQDAQLFLAMDRTHIFDAHTGEAIG
jgi:multiple sugar transport system ATP-binding protein